VISLSRLSHRWVLATVGYMAGIFYLSSLPGAGAGRGSLLRQLVWNTSHIPLFAGLGICLAMTLARWPWPSRAASTLGLGLAYSLFDEWHQSWSPSRSASLTDVMLDMIGLALAVWGLWARSRRHGRRLCAGS
jgi:VanZ family protein